METAKKVFLFSFIREFTNEEQEKLDSIVRSLGAISKLNEDMYVSDSTHIVVPDCVDQKWCPKLFGGLASGKEVVTGSYLFKSMKARKFLNEADFRPKYVKHIIDHVERHGKIFKNQTCIVLLSNTRRQAELKLILRDGGANVPNWSVADLFFKPTPESSKLDVIYTDLSPLNNRKFESFVSKRALDRPVRVLSFFGIFKVITVPTADPKLRIDLESQFDVKNKELMGRLHPQTAPKKTVDAVEANNQAERQTKQVIEVKLDSSDSEEETMVKNDGVVALSDEDDDIIVQKVIKKTPPITIVPQVKKRMTADIEYTIPKKKPRIESTEPTECIDLISSDEEIEIQSSANRAPPDNNGGSTSNGLTENCQSKHPEISYSEVQRRSLPETEVETGKLQFHEKDSAQSVSGKETEICDVQSSGESPLESAEPLPEEDDDDIPDIPEDNIVTSPDLTPKDAMRSPDKTMQIENLPQSNNESTSQESPKKAKFINFVGQRQSSDESCRNKSMEKENSQNQQKTPTKPSGFKTFGLPNSLTNASKSLSKFKTFGLTTNLPSEKTPIKQKDAVLSINSSKTPETETHEKSTSPVHRHKIILSSDNDYEAEYPMEIENAAKSNEEDTSQNTELSRSQSSLDDLELLKDFIEKEPVTNDEELLAKNSSEDSNDSISSSILNSPQRDYSTEESSMEVTNDKKVTPQKRSPKKRTPQKKSAPKPRFQEIDMFSAKNFGSEESAGSCDDLPETEEEQEPEAEALEEFLSKDLTPEMLAKYFFAFKKYQRDQLTGMDVCDEMQKKSFKFDGHCESLPKCVVDSNKNPRTEVFKKTILDNMVALDDEDEKKRENFWKFLHWTVTAYKSVLSSRHFFPPKILNILITDMRKEEKFQVRLKKLLVSQVIDLLYTQLNLHNLDGATKRKYFKNVFGGSLTEFIDDLIQGAQLGSEFDLELLKFVTEVLKRDIFYWRKHERNKGQKFPLIHEYLDKMPSSSDDENNANKSQLLLKQLKIAGQKPKDLELKLILNKILSFVAVLASYREDADHESLRKENSKKRNIATKVQKLFSETPIKLADIFCETFMLRPAWLSCLVMFRFIPNLMEENQPETELWEPEVKTLIRNLPGNSSLEKLVKTPPDFVLMILNSYFQTLPVNLIAMAIMRDKNALSNRVKLKSSKLKEVDNKNELPKNVFFDNYVALKGKELSSDISTCIDLINKIRLESSTKSDDKNEPVEKNFLRLHFITKK